MALLDKGGLHNIYAKRIHSPLPLCFVTKIYVVISRQESSRQYYPANAAFLVHQTQILSGKE